MGKKIIGSILCLALIVMLIDLAGHCLRPIKTDIAFNTIETFHSLPENSLEVIAYGSSLVWRGLNVMEMYEKYGVGAYNYGCNWQHINTTALFFYDSLRTQSPKVILIETQKINHLLLDQDMDGEIFYTKKIHDSKEKRKYLKQCFGSDFERYLSYYIPLLAYHENWVNLTNASFLDNSDNKDFRKTMGYVYTDDVVPITIGNYQNFEQRELNDSALAVLDGIVETCDEKNIQIIFYAAPKHGANRNLDSMEKYAEENNCVFLNLYEKAEEIGIDGNTDFCDGNHLNDNGARKVADYLAKYIIDNYEITDMRLVENNIWEQNITEQEK